MMWATLVNTSLFCFTYQQAELNGVLARNVEFSQLIIVYQQKLRENSEALKAAEDLSRKLTMEVKLFIKILYFAA